MRRATFYPPEKPSKVGISIHALLAESDANLQKNQHQRKHFYPRSPCGERQNSLLMRCRPMRFLSTLSLRRATECTNLAPKPKTFLSTLSLRRATQTQTFKVSALRDFYPRSPCGERPRAANCQQRNHHISIHALLAESDVTLICEVIAVMTISIHALLAESDNRFGRPIDVQFVFLSTLSLRRATQKPAQKIYDREISIHALLAESDHTCQYFFSNF